MNISLEQALQAVQLEPGHTYRCLVRGHRVEVQVLPDEPVSGIDRDALAPQDPWIELPQPMVVGSVLARQGAPDLPDVPDLSAFADE